MKWIIVCLFTLIKHEVTCIYNLDLGPMERNDNLRNIQSDFIAEWQWESWPIKQEKKEPKRPKLGPNIDLWSDVSESGSFWYLYNKQWSFKTEPDLWRYSTASRQWEKLYPITEGLITDTDVDEKMIKGKKWTLCVLPVKLTNINDQHEEEEYNFSIWKKSNKILEDLKKENEKELIIFDGNTNRVLKLNLENRTQLTELTNCTTNDDNINSSRPITPEINELAKLMEYNNTENILRPVANIIIHKNDSVIADKQDNEIINELTTNKDHNDRPNSLIKSCENETNLINMTHTPEVIINSVRENIIPVQRPKFIPLIRAEEIKSKNRTRKIKKGKYKGRSYHENRKNELIGRNEVLVNLTKLDVNYALKENLILFKENGSINETDDEVSAINTCPQTDSLLSWCSPTEGIVGLLNVDQSLAVFDIQQKQWTKKKVPSTSLWRNCARKETTRFFTHGQDIYVFCQSWEDPQNEFETEWLPSNYTNNTETRRNTARVYKIDTNQTIIQNLGDIEFLSEDWYNESDTFFQLVTIGEYPVLLTATGDNVNLWIIRNGTFHPVDNVWRGSAKKWFQNYNSSFYNMNIHLNKNSFETLLLNPRRSNPWLKERGRFIIRILRNENKLLKVDSNDEKNEGDNLVYGLLKSEENVEHEGSNIELIFLYLLGSGLITFSLFGVLIFVRKSVLCFRDDESRQSKTPPIIRYSVIDDDIVVPESIDLT